MNVEGIVRKVEEKVKEFKGPYSGGNVKKIHGANLTLETPEGLKPVYVPRTISLTDEHALLNQRVRYMHSSHQSGDRWDTLYGENYTLEVLSGSLQGLTIERRITY